MATDKSNYLMGQIDSDHNPEDPKAAEESALAGILQKLAFDDFSTLEKGVFSEDDLCSCDSCKERRIWASECLDELKLIQSYWLELRQYVRIIYRLAMKNSLRSVDENYHAYMKEVVTRLYEVCDPHQLYQRLESQVQEFVIEIKVRLLHIMDKLLRNSELPILFINDVIEKYNKLISAATEITPVLCQLEEDHLSKFKLTWKLINQRLFQTIIYTDPFLQKCISRFITQLERSDSQTENFINFDNELSAVEEIWKEVSLNIQQYSSKGKDLLLHCEESFHSEGINLSSDGVCECHVCQEMVSPHPLVEASMNVTAPLPKEGLILLDKETSQQMADKATQKDHDFSHQEEILDKESVSQPLKKKPVTPGTPCAKEDITDTSHCTHSCNHSKHSDRIKKCSERAHMEQNRTDLNSDSKQQCDCCYCEVFGNGLPPTAPMSRNYMEIRERLRFILSKKRTSCKAKPNIPLKHCTFPEKKGNPKAPHKIAGDTRNLEELLDYIEGNETKCRNEKKAAKKARQKERKIQLVKKKEEEEKAKELYQKALVQAELARAQKEKQAAIQNSSKKKSKNKVAEANVKTETDSSPQMVTIKRIMDSNNAEPTVTITLRGATPNQDRVLYTLLNGQVCEVKDKKLKVPLSNSSNKVKPIETKISNVTNKEASQIKKENPKKEQKKVNTVVRNDTPKNFSIKANGLTNPTAIQINNVVNRLSKTEHSSFKIEDLKLPPGITITKVDPSTIKPKIPMKEKTMDKNISSTMRPPSSSSEVIVVATGNFKEQVHPMKQELPLKMKAEQPVTGKKKKKNNQLDGSLTNRELSNIADLSLSAKEKNKQIPVTISMSHNICTKKHLGKSNKEIPNHTVSNDIVSKKKKKKSRLNSLCDINSEEWRLLDSVFAPKDIDLDNGDIDDDERELEAFKRFCSQSVPPKRKEKVHLNIKDIILKKKLCNDN